MRISGLPKGVRRVFRCDAFAAFLTGSYMGSVLPFLGVLARSEFHASPFLIAILNASNAAGNLFNPVIAQRIRNRAKLPYATVPFALGRAFFLLMPLALVAPVFVAISFAAIAVSTLGMPAYAAVIRDAYPVERRGQLMGLVRVLLVAGSMLGALVAGFFLAHVSFRWFIPVMALVGIIAIVVFSRIGVRAEPANTTHQPLKFAEAIRLPKGNRMFRLYTTCFFLYGFGNIVLGPVIPVFQVDILNITPQWVGYLATTASASSMLGYLIWGRVLDRHGPFHLMACVIAVIAIMPVTYLLAHSVSVLLIAAAATGIAQAGGDLGYVNAAMRFGPRDEAASYAGMFAFYQACRGIPAPFIGAFLCNIFGPRPLFGVALFCWIVALSILLMGGGLRNSTYDQAQSQNECDDLGETKTD